MRRVLHRYSVLVVAANLILLCSCVSDDSRHTTPKTSLFMGAQEGELLQVTGITADAKHSALVKLNNGDRVFVDGLAWWPRSAIGKRVTVRGRLHEFSMGPPPRNSEYAYFSGSIWVLEEPTWSVIEEEETIEQK